MAGVEGIHHVALRCLDLARCLAFYREVLGLAELRRWPDAAGGLRSVWLSTGEGFLALERADAGRGGPADADPFEAAPPGWQVVALGIRRGEREAWRARLRERGVKVERESPWSIFLRDPEGNRVALSHWPEDA